MHFLATFSPLALSAITAYAQTIYLAGDSTMAANGGGPGTGTDGKRFYYKIIIIQGQI